MAGKPGNRIVVDAERVGQAERTGEILEVIDRGVSVRYRVRWSDGRETLLSPAGGSARIVPGGAPTARSESSTASADARGGGRTKKAGKAGKQKAKKGSVEKETTQKKRTKPSGKAKGKGGGGSKNR